MPWYLIPKCSEEKKNQFNPSSKFLVLFYTYANVNEEILAWKRKQTIMHTKMDNTDCKHDTVQMDPAAFSLPSLHAPRHAECSPPLCFQNCPLCLLLRICSACMFFYPSVSAICTTVTHEQLFAAPILIVQLERKWGSAQQLCLLLPYPKAWPSPVVNHKKEEPPLLLFSLSPCPDIRLIICSWKMSTEDVGSTEHLSDISKYLSK